MLLNCFLVILVHGMVPHHHHHDALVLKHAGSCTDEHHDHGDDNEQPGHCHAFSEVTFYKTPNPGSTEPKIADNLPPAMAEIQQRSTQIVSEQDYNLPPISVLNNRHRGTILQLRGPPAA